jgi:zinc transport system substrate-binding protein
LDLLKKGQNKNPCQKSKRLPVRQKTILLSVTLIVFMHGCLFGDCGARSSIKITTSVFPLWEFAKAVTGERGEVELLLPPGAEIHTWRPRPSDILKITTSDVFVHIGADLEPWLDDVLRSVNNPQLRIFKASEGIALMERQELRQETLHEESHNANEHEHIHGALDPHIWLDFVIDQRIIDSIVRLLSQMEPENRALFESNGAAYKKKLDDLDRRFREELGRCKGDTFILGGHAAFGYLARRYNLHQISLFGLNPNASPTPKQLIRVVELAKEHHINVIYFEVYVSDDLARVIAEEVGARTLVLDPAANLTKEQMKTGKTFLDIMEQNLKHLKEGLSCG